MYMKSFVVQSLSRVWLIGTPGTAALQASLSFTISWSLFKLMSSDSVMLSNHLIPCGPLLLPLSFPESCVVLFLFFFFFFLMSQLLATGGQSTRISAPVLPENIQGWFPLGLTGLISLKSQGLSRVFSSTTIWKHQFFDGQPFLRSSSHIYPWLLEKL